MKNISTEIKAYLKKHSIDDDGLCKTIQFKVPLSGYNKLSKDAKENSYWEIDTYNWHEEVKKEWEKGNLVLLHKFHSVSVIMSKEEFEQYLYHPTTVVFSVMDFYEIEDDIKETYFKKSKEIEETGVLKPGYIFSAGVADGHANYMVTKVTKSSVSFEHLSFGDGYHCQHISAFGEKMPRKYFDKISHFGLDNMPFTKKPGSEALDRFLKATKILA
jgi:hypothetical protein